MSEYLLPDVGEGLTEAEIVSWKVKVGDQIRINDIVVEIETAKSLVELPSPYAGTVEALLVPEGETIAVGTPIIRVGDGTSSGSDDGPSTAETAPGKPAARAQVIDTNIPPAEGENMTLVGYGPREMLAQRRPRKGSATPATAAGATTQMQVQGAFAPGGAQSEDLDGDAPADEPSVPASTPEGSAASSEQSTRVLAKPPVRKLAKDLGVDLTRVSGNGPNGSIAREDVQAAADGSGPSTSRPDGYGDQETERREPIKGVRKRMGQAMVHSAFTAPHVTEWVTIDVTATTEFVERLRSRREFREVKASPLLVLTRACCLAMRRTPEINSYWDEQAQEIVFKRYVNLGIAAATPRGLVVPNIKDAERHSLLQLAEALGELTATARSGKTQPGEMSGGTFTITNVGVFGVDSGTPIINPGESAILCFGAVKRQPWVVGAGAEERIEIRDVTTLALAFDHRHIDGEKGSRFLADVAGIMSDPANALLF
ncbi:MAG: 2-oxo acid dehydrogenase subunit E2 [Actinomycetota bacterium]|nr:2-oxo acid dehydrogenase subunit E2 [Actinomycetota bacterium]